jgi:hypothetical protein
VRATPREARARRGSAVGLKQSPAQPRTEVGDDQRVPPGSGSGWRERVERAGGAAGLKARDAGKENKRGAAVDFWLLGCAGEAGPQEGR